MALLLDGQSFGREWHTKSGHLLLENRPLGDYTLAFANSIGARCWCRFVKCPFFKHRRCNWLTNSHNYKRWCRGGESRRANYIEICDGLSTNSHPNKLLSRSRTKPDCPLQTHGLGSLMVKQTVVRSEKARDLTPHNYGFGGSLAGSRVAREPSPSAIISATTVLIPR